jgi:hypothetical protein
MKYGYREVRKLSREDLRALCIRHDWYTGGTNEEYYNLMQMTEKECITTDDIVEIATDIIEHSETAKANFEKATGGEDFYEYVMFMIGEECYTYFERI